MKKLFTVIFLLFSFINTLLALDEGRFMRYPSVYKDKIVFTYENDLWLVSANGGVASRLTSSPGSEFAARFSPDGKTIAFTGGYDGGTQNVYVMPAEGGEPKRLTYNPGGGRTVGWTPDGSRIVFRSNFEMFISRDPNLYFVNKDGSAPERLPIDRGTLCSFSPDGTKMLYTRKGADDNYWKRYKGGTYPDIWMYDFTSNKFSAVTNYVGKNTYPMWIENQMFFVCDRTNGVSNLCTMDLSTKEIKDVTSYSDVDVMMPSTDGSSIVFMHDGYIHLLDVKTKAVRKVEVLVPSDRWALRNRYINPKEYIHYMNVSNDAGTAILEARGDVFSISAEKSSTLNLSQTPGSREMYPQISPDGKWITFFSDKTGEYQLYMQKTEGGEWIQLTKELNRTNYHPVWSPDGKKILFGNGEFTIYYLDIASKKLIKVDHSNQLKNDEFYWEISDYQWSPDSKWITYSLVQYNRNSQIFVYNIETGKKYPVTNDFYDNLYPSFDANGRYLYYVSSRNFDVQMDFYEDNHVYPNPQQIMAVQLRDGEAPLFSESVKAADKKQDETVKIDTDGLLKRTYPLPVPAGNYFYLKAGKGKVAWSSVPKFTEAEYEEIFKPGSETKWDLHIFDIAKKSEVVLSEKIRDFNLSANQENMIIQKGQDFYTTSLEKAFQSKSLGDKLDLSRMSYQVDNLKEWNQIFSDTWRWYRDFFYDKNMHGRDWKAIGEKYRSYIPQLTSREDLNWVMQQLVGELCVSHTYVGGGDMGLSAAPNIPSSVFSGWLGSDLKADKKTGYYIFEKIYGPDEYNLNLKSPLSRPDIILKEGDYLIAINGKEVKVPEDYFALLQVSPGQKVSVTVSSTPKSEGARTYEVEPIRNDQSLRYFRWISDNIKKVTAASNGKLGYMHINAMNSAGIAEFDKYWRAFRYKDGILIDVRRNSGGWTEYFMIDKLERKMTAYNCLTGMEPFRYPGSTSTGKFAAISNEYNGSDGEAFIEDFKANKLGKVVGVPSWGGLVGIINNQKTIDNGSVDQSNNAFFGKEGNWLVENHGADPDVLIDNDPQSVMAGHDPQLEKAIEVVLEQINKEPFRFSERPAYPIR